MSDFVIMPKADYVAACNSVRAKTGKSDTIKSGDLSAEIDSITGGGSSDDVRYVTFMSYDGSVEYLRLPVAVGYDCQNPKIDTPKKESDVQYNYTFAGWATTPNGGLDSNALKAVNEDRTVYANFAAVVRYYTITYLDTDGSVLKTESLAYGSMPSYIPEKDGYGFEGWNPELETVAGDASYTAVWAEKITFANGTWEQIAEICDAGQARDYFAIGDTKTITVSGENITLSIAGFDHDDLANGSGKAAISIVCMNIPSKFKCMWHYDGGRSGYNGCNARYYLQNTFSADLPLAMRTKMKSVVKKCDSSNSGGTPNLTSLNETLWFLSLDEMGFSCDDNRISNLGQRYELFPALGTYEKADPVNVGETTTKASYWTRSVRRVGVWNPCYMAIDGSYNNTSSSGTTEHYIRFGFCI